MRKKKPRPATPLPRKIHIGKDVWTYQIYSSRIVAFVNPELTLKHLIHGSHINEEFGKPYWDDFCCEDRIKVSLVPSQIKEYILKELVSKKVAIKKVEAVEYKEY